ncbi:hypothetical protein BpHYR1_050198 [Brachionus plicatilis]|uniref:Uncharacterized protein n=1 Tax=Brachionus plicatilis TaxID=10195 RepID=A0A3M7SG98_BRAPC|nr:hypothetical protein BpHYR1_050198 [Brachionus plicatilis]
MTSNSSLAFDTNSKTKPINLVDPTKLTNSFADFHSTSFTETKTTEKAQRELTRLRKKLANNSNQDDLSNQLNFKNSILYFQSASNFADKYYNSLKNNNQNMETSNWKRIFHDLKGKVILLQERGNCFECDRFSVVLTILYILFLIFFLTFWPQEFVFFCDHELIRIAFFVMFQNYYPYKIELNFSIYISV